MILHPVPRRVHPLPRGLRIRRASTIPEVNDLQRAAALSYGVPYEPGDPRWLEAPFISLYVGYFDGAPAVHGALIAAHGVAGIAYVGTVPGFRHRGFAQALVERVVAEGRRRGCEAAYLWATRMGYGVYRHLGFRKILDYRIWSPPEFPLPEAFR